VTERESRIWSILDAYRVIIDCEMGHEVDEDTLVEAMQLMVDTGYIQLCPGRYGRMAQDMIDDGRVVLQ